MTTTRRTDHDETTAGPHDSVQEGSAAASKTTPTPRDDNGGDADSPDVADGANSTSVADGADTVSKAKKSADRLKFIGLIAFFVVMAIVMVALWPYIGMIFEEGGVERLTDDVRNAGWGGVGILLAVQFLQVVVAFIPGEVVQVAAGAIYGPWWGALIIVVGCVISSAFIFMLVHKLGAPFVQDMVPQKYLDKFRQLEESGKFNVIVFILFLIPGMPKDVLTYIVPLSDMRLRMFLAITTVARIPGIVVSTYAADGLMEGRIWESVAIFLVLAGIAGFALLFYNKIIDALHKTSKK